MNILVVNGSPRKMVCHAFVTELEIMARDYGHKVDVINLVDYNIAYCQACEGCRHGSTCVLKDDYTSVIEPKMKEADLEKCCFPHLVQVGSPRQAPGLIQQP